jgi:two-component system, NtrC family, sensor kinase
MEQSTTLNHSDVTNDVQSQLLRLVMDTLPEHIFWKDRNSVFLGCNQKVATVAGLRSPADIVGKTDYDLPWKPEEAEFFQMSDRRVMESNTAELGIIEPILQADGRQAWIETNKIPLHDDQGNVIGIMCSFQDVTARYDAELALKRLNEELEQRVAERTATLQQTLEQLQQAQIQMVQAEKMSSLGQLVAGIAHEINNPINFIHGNLIHVQKYADDLLQVAKGDGVESTITPSRQDLEFIQTDLPKLLSSMRTGTDRVRDIVLSLRNFSRLDESASKTVDLHQGIDSTLLILQHRCVAIGDRPAITIHREYAELPKVECYSSQLNQVFINILNNSIDALETSQSTTPKITIQTRTIDDNRIEITITDNGIGIPEAVKGRIFDPFFTTKPVGQGTGMGLAISYQIITTNHQGELYCESDPATGTQFTIVLPLQPASPTE